MTHHSVFRKELIKLYSTCQKIHDTFQKLSVEYLDTSGIYIFKLFLALNTSDIKTITLILKTLKMELKLHEDITAESIFNSLEAISSQNVNDNVRRAMFYVSLNRLINYKLASVQNVLSLNTKELNTNLVETYNATRDIKIRVAKQLELINERSTEKILS